MTAQNTDVVKIRNKRFYEKKYLQSVRKRQVRMWPCLFFDISLYKPYWPKSRYFRIQHFQSSNFYHYKK